MINRIFFIIFVLGGITMLGMNIYEHIVAKKEVCVWCRRPIFNDEIEVQYKPKREVHRIPCDKELTALTEKEFGNEWSMDRLKEMNRLIDKRR